MITKKEFRIVVITLLSIITLTTIFKNDCCSCNDSKNYKMSASDLKELEKDIIK